MNDENLPIITNEQLKQKVLEVLPEFFLDALKNKYDSPIKKVIEEEVKNQEGTIRVIVKEALNSIINSEETKKVIAQEVISKILSRGLSN